MDTHQTSINFHFHCPGEKYAYSNLGYLVLGMVIEALSCMPYENYVKQLLRKLDIEEVYVGLTTQQKVDYQEVSSQIRTQSILSIGSNFLYDQLSLTNEGILLKFYTVAVFDKSVRDRVSCCDFTHRSSL